MYKYLEILSISILIANIYLLFGIYNTKIHKKLLFETIILLSMLVLKSISIIYKIKYTLVYSVLYIILMIYIFIRITKKYIKDPYDEDTHICDEIIKIDLYNKNIKKQLDVNKYENNKLDKIRLNKEKIINLLEINSNKYINDISFNHEYENKILYENLINLIPNIRFIKDIKSDEFKYIDKNFLSSIKFKDYKFIDINSIINLNNKECMKFERNKIINENGKKIDIEYSGLVLDINNEILLIGIIKDITKQVKIDAMENKIKENEIVNKSKAEFFINMSHELKTPLNLINASNQLIDSVYSKELKENNNLDILKEIKIIKKQINILSTLTENMIELSKLQNNYHEINIDSYNIVEILDEIVEEFNNHTNKNDINIIFDTDEEETILNIDPDDIEKVIIILLSLVARYSSNNSYINFEVKNKSDFIIISINNNGRYNNYSYLMDIEKNVIDMGVKLANKIIELYNGSLSIYKDDKNINISIQIKNICKSKDYKIRVKDNHKEFIHSEYTKMCNY